MRKPIKFVYHLSNLAGNGREVTFNGVVHQDKDASNPISIEEFNMILMGTTVMYQDVEYRYAGFNQSNTSHYIEFTLMFEELRKPATTVVLDPSSETYGLASAKIKLP